ncbi:hypothetical protein HZS_2914 [Henneguya salminicola]|nr:hypothetical protein HZS_2914 [Henneguya salminicola]
MRNHHHLILNLFIETSQLVSLPCI